MHPNKINLAIADIPYGFSLIEAYSNGEVIVVPISLNDDDEHNCDQEGCSTVSHVKRFYLS